METRKRRSNRRSRLWAMALAAALACALLLGTAQAAPATGAAVMPDDASPKPVVTIQGNVVVDKGKPTGFYELALCVRTARTVTLKDGTPVSEATYAAELAAALESGKKEDRDALDAKYDVQNYPFQSAAATVHIDLDALTAVTWGAGTPVYEDWTAAGTTGGNGTYANYNTGYPRGLDLSGAVEQPDIFTNLDKIINGTAASVRLDTANPDEMTNATALVEDYDAASRTALLTLSANTTTSANVVYETETPVVVVRFAYDLDRFRKTDVLTQPNQSDFWLGLDRNATGGPNTTGQKALTFLAEGDLSGDLSASDAQAAEASIHQTVWYSHNMLSDQTSQKSTNFYYYLGAETPATQGTGTYVVIDGGTVVTPSPTLTIPKTQGNAVLARHSDAYATTGDPDAGQGYSFFQNLLTMKEGTLRLELVNAETYRKPAGGGGTTILFYDWDDSLIGVLVVDKGDVRAEVNEYVEQNLVHPDLRASQYLNSGKVPEPTDATRADYANLLNSLERQYTYRGKYPFEVGGSKTQNDPDDATVLDGSEYPLTNKLDYAFYRRINRITEDSDVNGAKTNYFSTSSLLEEENLDAALYPYVYGWAVVEDPSTLNHNKWQVRRDAEKLEDVWTTIGVGELANVKPGVGRTDTPIPAAGTGTRTVVEPAFIAEETEKNPVAPPTDYQYTTASTEASRYFRFADFSDIDAELKRYTKENGGNKDTLIVKAVYEPGESLIAGSYQMIQEPYYNKMNRFAASGGGAYSVQITLERSSNNLGDTRGVTRVRMPAVRQDTTADQKWIQDNALGVDHNLSNASVAVAKKMSETTFTKVDVDNGEEVQFTLSLSARQNKVDYYIIEQYGFNFVSGGQRSTTNYDQVGTAFAVDNYNYFAEGDSDENDAYYDIREYEERDGSHGFVLYGTLNNLMQQATEYNNGNITSQMKNQYLTYANMQDANLRIDSEGTKPDDLSEASMQDTILAAAKLCKTAHYGDPDFWNDKLNCAELTYHQLQWYIIDGVLYDRATADDSSHKLAFCHLHAACAELLSDKPKDWESLVQVVLDNNADAIDQMSLTEIEDISHLRSSVNGGVFGNVATFKNRFKLAVEAGNTSWVDIQRAMLNGNGGIDTFWWYDGARSNPAPSNLAALGQLAQSALHAQKYPDGTTSITFSKLESARSAFNQNAAADPPKDEFDGIHKASKVAPVWVRLTNNLVKAHHEDEVGEGDDAQIVYTHDKFDDFEDFLTAYLAALAKAEGDGFGYADGLTTPTWEGIQNAILHPDDIYDNSSTGSADADFWWKDGKTPFRITTVGSLLRAAEYVNTGNVEEKATGQEALNKLTVATLEGEPFWFRSTMQGKPWSEDMGDPVTATELVEQILNAQKAGVTDWDSLQYYFIHGKCEENAKVMTDEATFYWWKKGGEGTEINFAGADLNTVIGRLQTASLRGDRFGDPKAKGSVTAQLADGSFYKLTHLTPTAPTDAQTTVGDMTWYTDTDTLLSMITNMVTFMKTQQGITGDYAMPSVTWHQVQHWILTGDYIVYGTDAYAKAEKDYWWYDQDKKPEEKPPQPEPTEALVGKLEAALKDGTAVTLTAAEWTDTGLKGKNQTTNTTNKIAQFIMANLVTDLNGSPYYDAGTGKLNLTWVQIQYYVTTALAQKATGKVPGTLADHATALAGLKSLGWSTSKFPEGVITE